MRTPEEDAWLQSIRNELDLFVPIVVTDEQWDKLAEECLATFGSKTQSKDTYTQRIARLLAAGYEFGDESASEVLIDPKHADYTARYVSQLYDNMRALLAGTPASGPLPENEFCVTRHNDRVKFYMSALHPMVPEKAVRLGVWLIAVADPTLSDAVPMLLRVATR